MRFDKFIMLQLRNYVGQIVFVFFICYLHHYIGITLLLYFYNDEIFGNGRNQTRKKWIDRRHI